VKTDIIIPSWNQHAHVRCCLDSIKANSQDYSVIFVDNNSQAFNEILDILSLMPHRLIRNSVNTGFVKAVNQGLAFSTAPEVVLLNNDTEVPAGWLDKLREPLLSPEVGASGPLTDASDSWQGRRDRFPVASEWTLIPETAMLSFFCVMLKREALDQVGYLDEAYGVGLGDDDDYCERLHAHGWRLALAQSCLVKHHHRTTFKALYTEEEITKMQAEAMERLKSP